MTDATAPAIRLLDVPRWRAGAGSWTLLAPKDALLLAMLALDGPCERGIAAGLLWPAAGAVRAGANLRQRLYRWRVDGLAALDPTVEGLALHPRLRCDLTGRDPSAPLDGTLLEGLGFEGRERELQQQLDRWRQLWSHRRPAVLLSRADAAAAAGRAGAAADACRALLALEPAQEAGWQRLVALQLDAGDQAGAEASCARGLQALAAAGREPTAATRALLERVAAIARQGHAAWPAPLRRPWPTVGRDMEQGAMAAAWRQDRAFVLVGEAGAGKSSLLQALADADPGAVIERARPEDRGTPYATASRWLRRWLHRAGPPDAPELRAELARLLPELGPAPPAQGHPALLVDAACRWRTLALPAGLETCLLDDLQHADAASLALLRPLAAAGGRWGFATRPPAPRAELPAGTSTIELAPLDGAAVRSLLQSLALPGLDAAALAPALARGCGGNPLFMLETLRERWVHGGLRAGAAHPLAPGVERLLAARLARLSPAALALARLAAIAGDDFDAPMAAAVHGHGPDALHELQASQVLVGHRLVHEPMQQALAASLSSDRRRQLHADVATVLQQRGCAPERIAFHLAAAGRSAHAGAASLAAAAHAERCGDMGTQHGHLLAAAASFDAAGDPRAAFAARVRGLTCGAMHQGLPAALALAGRLAAAAVDAQDRIALGLAHAGLALWNHDGAAAAAQARAVLAEAVPGTVDELRAGVTLACGLAMAGQAALGRQALQALEPRIDALADDPLLAAELQGLRAMVLNRAGELADSALALARQITLAQQAGHVEAELSARGGRAGTLAILGRADEALAELQRGKAAFARFGDSLPARGNDLNLALSMLARLRLDEAAALLAGVTGYAAAAAPGTALYAVAAEMRCELALRLDDPLALATAAAALPALGEAADRRLQQLELRARMARRQGDPAQAARLWHQVLAEVPGHPSSIVARLRPWLGAAMTLEAGAAIACCDRLEAECAAVPFPAGVALVRLRRAQARRRAGQTAGAADDLQAAVAALPDALHHVLDPAELIDEALRGLQAADRPAAAARLRARARRWWNGGVRPHLDPATAARLLAQPAFRAWAA